MWRGVDRSNSAESQNGDSAELAGADGGAAYTSDDAAHLAFLAGDVLVEST